MSDPRSYLWLIPLLPLTASILTAFLGPTLLRKQSHWPCIIATILSCILSLMLLTTLQQNLEQNPELSGEWKTYYPYTWIQAGEVNVTFTLRMDTLTAIMLVTVTFIGSLIAIFAVGYMHGDPGYSRFFAEIALFIFSMTGLVLANNFILLFAFWEGVGLCSYLLVGFWFAKPSAAAAARKAFLVTRIGDTGFILGIILLWSKFGYHLDYDSVFKEAYAHQELITVVCLLLFCGAVGKSAQFPLHVWLPDAMEGPTPVSALIHAATMVTAGVYLVARCTPLFILSPTAQLVVACIGGFTALLAALIALTQNDLKRVLAYSTISQLGYMFLALGSGAVVAAIFHLFTHAFFKALLFLSAGSVMHAMGNVIDMRRFGGLRHVLKTTHATFLCGAGALAGVPLLAGFWSKDEILAGTLAASHTDASTRSTIYMILLLVGVFTAGLTAFYTFRAYFLTFWGKLEIPHEAGRHAHESPPVMTIPLIVLAAGALFAGYVNAEPLTHWLSSFLHHTKHLEVDHQELSTAAKVGLMAGSSLVVLAGISLAAWLYLMKEGMAAVLAGRAQWLYQASLNKFYLDEIYNGLIVKPLTGLAHFCRGFDFTVLDEIVDLIGQSPRMIGQMFRPVQNGLVQFYALAMLLGLTVFLIALWSVAG